MEKNFKIEKKDGVSAFDNVIGVVNEIVDKTNLKVDIGVEISKGKKYARLSLFADDGLVSLVTIDTKDSDKLNYAKGVSFVEGVNYLLSLEEEK